ncbi:hypothetical protein GGR50DRAFT_440137 [Xylaria sp. CBS 124048]|nr:hypothetical protein GGR50DRAFT_440137 [Xylaria sp. CBS 124048]
MDITARRRKLRKGTRSCCECKRRKVRCVFTTASEAVCMGCRRRGTSCVSQAFSDDELSETRIPQPGDRAANLEAIVRDLARSVATGSGAASPGNPAGNNLTWGNRDSSGTNSQPLSPRTSSLLHLGNLIPYGPNKYIQLSRSLFEALPPQGDVELIWKAGNRTSVHLVHHFQMSPEDNERTDIDHLKQRLLRRPSPNAHPVLIARYMLILAKFMQYLPPQCFETLGELSLPPRTLMRRLAETASSLAIDSEELLGTIEGLECVIIEGTFQANIGNIRRAWLAYRRALSIAQLMGIHRAANPAPPNYVDSSSTSVNYQTMWFRIVYVDRFLSLMLGLPPGSLDYGVANKSVVATETPLGQLSRIHCTVAAQILERNDCDSTDYEFTQKIDEKLQKAANSLPSKWWLTPNLAATDEQFVFREVLTVVEQIYHYNLLNQLYLPFILQYNEGPNDTDARKRSEYAKHTCINSSREVLTRFNALRSSSGIALCCRSVDFLGLMAAITLLLAHLSSHLSDDSRKFASNLMIHQRLSDRAIIERMLEYMEEVGHWNTDILTQKSAEWARQLLIVEADAADGQSYTLERISARNGHAPSSEEHTVLISLAYFGVIGVTRRGKAMGRRKLRFTSPQLNYQTRERVDNRTTMDHDIDSTSSYTSTHCSPHTIESSTNGSPEQQASVMDDTMTGFSPRDNMQNLRPALSEFPVSDSQCSQFPYVLTNDMANYDDGAFETTNGVSFENLVNNFDLDLIGNGSLQS